MSTMSIILIAVFVVIIVVIVQFRTQARALNRHREINAQSADAKSIAPDGSLPAEIQAAIDSGKKLQAVKLYKNYAKCSLAEAQSFIESRMG